MADEGKRTECIPDKVTERMALDLLRLAALDDRSLSDYLYRLLQTKLYGAVLRLESSAGQTPPSDKVNR